MLVPRRKREEIDDLTREEMTITLSPLLARKKKKLPEHLKGGGKVGGF